MHSNATATQGLPLYSHGIALIPAEINNHMLSKECNEIIFPFPNLAATVEIW